ncbi:MAG: hypothetical protein ACKO92_07440, partial [Actinomycetota bacterium]
MSKAVSRAAWAMVFLAPGATVLHGLSPADSTTDFIYLVAAAQVVFAVLVGVLINKPDRKIWSSILFLIFVLLIAQFFDNRDSSSVGAKLFSESLFLAVQLILVLGLFLVVRRRIGGDPMNVVFDALVISLASWFFIWVGFLNPARAFSPDDVSATVIRGLTLASSAIVVFMLATLLFGSSVRTPSTWLASGAILSSLVGDVLYATNQSGRLSIDQQIANAPYVASLFLVSATVLHPSVATLSEQTTSRVRQPLLGRMILTTTALVLPILFLALSNPTDDSDRFVRAASIFVLAATVTARVVFAVRANAALQERLIVS